MALVIFGFYVAIPILILIRVIPWDLKFHMLTIGAILIYILLRIIGIRNEQLGFSTRDTLKSLRDVMPLTLGLVALAAGILVLDGSRYSPTEDWKFFLFYVFISCPAQEFLYRGAMRAMCQSERLPVWLEYTTASLLFAFVHVIYRDSLTVVFMLVVGLAWYHLYRRTENLIGVTVSHAILGVLTIATGLVD